MYHKLDSEDLEMMEKVAKLTGMDYELNGDFIPVESLLHSVEDLMCEVGKLEEKIEDLEKDIEDNYRAIPVSEQYDISDRDFI